MARSGHGDLTVIETHRGPITRAFLEALLWGFHDAHTGRCFPSYEAIAVSAECNRDTVYEALKVLEWAGVLTWQVGSESAQEIRLSSALRERNGRAVMRLRWEPGLSPTVPLRWVLQGSPCSSGASTRCRSGRRGHGMRGCKPRPRAMSDASSSQIPRASGLKSSTNGSA